MRANSIVGTGRGTHISAMDKNRPPLDPEIIPPGQPLPGRAGEVWESRDSGPVNRIYIRQVGVSQVGPLPAILLALGLGAAVVFGVFALIGTAIIGLAAIGALVVVGAIAGILRGPPRPH